MASACLHPPPYRIVYRIFPDSARHTLSDATGTKLSRYEILSAIGKGGMGEVWKAKDIKLGREVVVKAIAPTSDLIVVIWFS